VIFLNILFPVFLTILSGVLFARIFRSSAEPLTQFALYFATPALILHALVAHPISGGAVLKLSAVMLLYTAVLWALAEGTARLLGLDGTLRRAFCLAVVPMNVGNYGLPLVRFAFGAESVPFSVLVFVIFNLPLATWAIWVAAGGGASPLRGLRETLRIPIAHATVLAFALSALGWQVPEPLMKTAALLGDSAIPLLMVILGMQLGRTRLLGEPSSMAAATVLRLGVSPFVAWALTSAFGFTGAEQKIVILQTSTPAAVLPLLYALRFDCRPDWIASNLLLSTLVSAASLSVVLYFLL
jgi:malate permease and related proteins